MQFPRFQEGTCESTAPLHLSLVQPLIPKQQQQQPDWKGNPVVLPATAKARCKGGKSSPFYSQTLNIKICIFEESET